MASKIDDAVKFVETVIRDFVRTSPQNRMPDDPQQHIFEAPLIGYADGDDTLFRQYKIIIAPTHLTPREALSLALDRKPRELPPRLSVISWILPIALKTRQSNRAQTTQPSRYWSYTRWHGEHFNEALRAHLVRALNERDYLAAAPAIQPYFKTVRNEKGPYSNWSERHIAHAAGLGTFSLSDGFITARGIAHRCGSVVTDLILPPGPPPARGPYANCLYYFDGTCKACIARCPAGAITEAGHDKNKCNNYYRTDLGERLRREYQVGITGCGLCQTKVPCEFKNPVTQKLQKQHSPDAARE